MNFWRSWRGCWRRSAQRLQRRQQMSARRNRRLRGIFWAALTAVAVLFVLGITAACIQARAFEFWHAWGWFGYSSGIAG